MYDIVSSVIGSAADPTIVNSICGVLIVLFSVVFIDMIRDIFSGFFRG